MAARHKSRRRALQILFEFDMRGGSVDDAIAHYYQTLHSDDFEDEGELAPDEFAEQLVRGTAGKQSDIDRAIEARAANWKLNRMPVVDRNILRLAIYELGLKTLPPAVVIDEAIALAKKFSSDESLSFINAVLDAVSKQAAAN